MDIKEIIQDGEERKRIEDVFNDLLDTMSSASYEVKTMGAIKAMESAIKKVNEALENEMEIFDERENNRVTANVIKQLL